MDKKRTLKPASRLIAGERLFDQGWTVVNVRRAPGRTGASGVRKLWIETDVERLLVEPNAPIAVAR